MRLIPRPELPFRADDPSYMDDWSIADRVETVAQVAAWYDNGRDFYARRILSQVIDEQHAHFEEGDTFNIDGVDGNTYQYNVNPTARPTIDYKSWYELLSDANNAIRPTEWRPFHAYCSVRLANYIEEEDESFEEDPHWLGEMSDASDELYSPTEATLAKQFYRLADLRARLREKRAWPGWNSIIAVLSSLRMPRQIDKVFGIGCGSLEAYEDDTELYNRCTMRHVFVYCLAKSLNRTRVGHPGVARYFQDPTYTDLDEEAIRRLHAHILVDPVAYLEMDEASVVFSSDATCCVKSIIVENARPAILILDRPRNDGSASELTDPFTSRVEWILDTEYQSLRIPQFHDDYWVPMAMYIRNEFIPPAFVSPYEQAQVV
ncbi:hypothetical protein ASPVEDRAFT_881969 [Aspergillus versicolor CBS 583.65]|uniref:SRR1-like domain-containing protein n=1 Tax=Aspergillus versicolor CBS 583.65 TaxID=1036611 RepID=A0A1L9PBP2_ASPVE|nr:uncharacterized protein ASPVEDRAFT_881969 [Aspergillus versicolor CBS 583.65]OJI98864.1 hypothetical protein ASPVEDRAFT_881969 [Aspergillus versicolor CBS 583.65]